MHRILNRVLLVVALASVAFIVPLRDANAALNAYLKLESQPGAKSSKAIEIKGEATDAGHKDEIEVLSYSHEVVSPRDAASGLPTGKRQHKPFQVTIALSPKTAPTLIGLLDETQPMQATLTATKKGKGGKQEDFLIIEIKEVLVSSYRIETDADGTDVIVLDLAYKSIQGKFMDGTVFLKDGKAATAKSPATKPAAKAMQ